MSVFGARAQSVLFTESFENTVLPIGWSVIDADNDGNNWMHSSVYGYVNGADYTSGSYVSFSLDPMLNAPLTPDEWLVSPPINLGSSCMLTFYRMVSVQHPEDHYGVYVSTTSATDTSAFTLLYSETPTGLEYAWTSRAVDLSPYRARIARIARKFFRTIAKGDPGGSPFLVSGFRFQVSGFRFKVQGSRFKVQRAGTELSILYHIPLTCNKETVWERF